MKFMAKKKSRNVLVSVIKGIGKGYLLSQMKYKGERDWTLG